MSPKVGLGIVLYERPEYSQRCLASIQKHLEGVVDSIWIIDDGSKEKLKDPPYRYHWQVNAGVGKAKNWLFEKLLDEECEYLFICESDMLIKSPKAVTEYIRLSDESGIEHFNFAHHGPANAGKPHYSHGGVDIYGNPVGAWSFYTRRVLHKVGLMDEHFTNAWEHVFHSWLISRAGYTTPWPYAACDITDSRKYLREIPGSIKNTSIKHTPEWLDNMLNGLIYWKSLYPEEFPLQHILDSLLDEEKQALTTGKNLRYSKKHEINKPNRETRTRRNGKG